MKTKQGKKMVRGTPEVWAQRPSSIARARRIKRLRRHLAQPRSLSWICATLKVGRKTAWQYLRELRAERANLGRPAKYVVKTGF